MTELSDTDHNDTSHSGDGHSGAEHHGTGHSGDVVLQHASGTGVTTLAEAFQETIRQHPTRVAMRTVGGSLQITWAEYGQRVARIAAGLAGIGIGTADAVGIMLTNRPEFHLVDTAALHLGAVPFSIYNTSSPEQIAYLFGNAGNRVVITEQAFLERITQAGVAPAHIVCVDGPAAGTRTLADVEKHPAADFDFTATWTAVRPTDLATIIYTSGTTGPPKGVELTHANVLAQMTALVDMWDVGPDDRIVSYLPAAHVADRLSSHYSSIVRGAQLTTVADPREIGSALPDVHPTAFLGVPRVWQKFRAAIEAKLLQEPSPIKRRLTTWAFDTGLRTARAELSGASIGRRLALAHRIADNLVLGKVRAALALDEVHSAAAGAAPIPPELLEYFFALGIRITELWGLSETTGAATSTAVDRPKLGSVGKAVRGVEVALADDGEVLVRGPIVMRGYRKQPAETAAAIDADGWFATGDIATIDADGDLTIVDRKKELIINQAGKNIAPTNIENAMKAASSLIGSIAAIGDGKPYITALVVLDPDAAAAQAKSLGIADTTLAVLTTRPEIRDHVTAAVRAGNAKLSRPERIKRLVLLDRAWEPSGDELTPKGSLRRAPIADKYQAELTALYLDPPGDGVIDLGGDDQPPPAAGHPAG